MNETTDSSTEPDGVVDENEKDTPGCFSCGGSTRPVRLSEGIVVGGYCGDCHVITGRHGGCAAL